MSAELKFLQVRLRHARLDMANRLSEMKDAQTRYSEAQKAVGLLEKQIESLTQREVVVSEHALLRYCERVYGCDLESIKAEILTPQVVNCINTLGNGKFPTGNGLKAVVKDRVVVSVME